MNEKIIGVLKFALVREREGMEFYRNKKNDMKTPNVREVFESLEEMERAHVNYIMELIENISRGDEISLVSIPSPSFFEKRTKEEEKGIAVDNIMGDLSVLRTAYLIEKDFADFYKEAANKSENAEIRKAFEDLSTWETEHKNTLLMVHNELMKEYWGDQGFAPLY
ncbi:hypothetical protein AT15_01355 [Kosmotoga arenicorallina S304]|uniref:Rubrerythrin diiron-binding domain-containing protein n=1 Tax=Kosmotoga arenicorallina S304 TaxID=1453497 RepID=A0A176JZZ1_9BACT|nr:ferritin family protein [Kosmotoga arenicorallina]OAA29716.1 hypothetical protein AT15_01355 [Kosmotoga arenicorallina S304]